MKPRDFLNFFKTRSGKLVAFGTLFAAALIIFSVFRKHHTSAEDATSVTALSSLCRDDLRHWFNSYAVGKELPLPLVFA
jgi:hypothetical protein